MQNNVAIIYRKFCRIKGLNWVKSKRSGSTGVGYTLECLFGKKEDSLPLPDYCGFEIKAMRKNSNKKIHLLNLNPDGNGTCALNRIVDNLRYPNKKNRNYKSFCVDINGKSYRKIGNNKRVIIYTNYEKERLELIAYKNEKLLNLDIYWSFEELNKRLYQKIRYLCLIEADSKFINKNEYFYYYKITFYKYFGFRTFLKLLNMGLITVNFKIDCYEQKHGILSSHGVDFTIKQSHIKYLFKKI